MKGKKHFLTQVNDTTYKYHEPMSYEGMDLSIKFTIKKRSDGWWFSESMDVEARTPQGVMKKYFEAVSEIAQYEAQCG